MVDSTTFLLSLYQTHTICNKVKMHDKSRTNTDKSRRIACPFKERSKSFLYLTNLTF